MLPLAIVRFACDERERVGSLLHVLRHISLFLLDVSLLEWRDVVQYNDLELLQYLVLDPNCPLGGGVSMETMSKAMETAIAENKMEFLQFLVIHGPSFYWNGISSSTVMEHAAQYGNLQAIQWLVQQRQASCYPWVLEKAAQNGHVHVLQFLLEHVVDPKDPNCAADSPRLAWMAARNGHQQVVEYLVQEFNLSSIEIESVRRNALHEAHLRLVGWLDQVTGNNDATVVDAMHHTSISINSSIVEKLGRHRDVAELKWFNHRFPEVPLDPKLLVFACEADDLGKVEWLLQKLVLPKQHQELQEALTMACAQGRLEVVQLLLSFGASQESLTLDGAVMNGHLAMVQFLRSDCNVTSWTNFGKSISKAAQNGFLDTVRLFHSQFVGPYPANAYYNAASTGNIPMLRFLLSTPHDTKVYRETMKWAFWGGQLQAAELLLGDIKTRGLYATLGEEFVSLRKELQTTVISQTGVTTRGMVAVLHLLLCQEDPHFVHEGEDFGEILQVVHQTSDFVPLIQLLHERKATAGFTDPMIVEAARRGYLKTVQFLFEHRSRLFASSAADQAARSGHLTIVKWLFEQDIEPFEMTIEQAASNGHWRIVQFLYENQSFVDNRYIARAFLQAASNGHLQVIKYLLSVDDALDVQAAFCRACSGSYVNLGHWFLQNASSAVELAKGIAAAKQALKTAKYNALDIQRMISWLEGHSSG